jgi:crotonobetainyl-CoA:carnitine CoA-transferase CaiB-like acyl-CoA transferase
VSLSAWGEDGPWGARRGFDSLVQAATGVAVAVRPPGGSEPPGALPVQALDHATGHLLAAAALRALTGRAIAGRAGRARLALAATAEALLAAGPRAAAPEREVDAGPYLTTLEHPAGRLTVVRPPGALDGRALAWPSRLRPGGPRYS